MTGNDRPSAEINADTQELPANPKKRLKEPTSKPANSLYTLELGYCFQGGFATFFTQLINGLLNLAILTSAHHDLSPVVSASSPCPHGSALARNLLMSFHTFFNEGCDLIRILPAQNLSLFLFEVLVGAEELGHFL